MPAIHYSERTTAKDPWDLQQRGDSCYTLPRYLLSYRTEHLPLLCTATETELDSHPPPLPPCSLPAACSAKVSTDTCNC